MFQYYPEYCGAPYDMMTWLFGQVKANEDMYQKGPSMGGQAIKGAGSDDEEPSGMAKDTPFNNLGN